jgi:PAS domain S-box-containing protein
VYPPDLPPILELFARVQDGGDTSSEFRVQTAAGELRWVHDSTRLILKDGGFVAAHGVLVDITQRKQAEEALKESEERWHALVTNAPDSVLTLDAEGRVLFVNHLPQESGLTPQSLTGRSIVDIVVPEHRPIVRGALRQVFAGGVSVVYESAVRRPSGAVVWHASHMGPLWRGDRVTTALLIARNITEHKEAEEALRESEERWHALVSNAPDLISTVDREGRMLYVNRLPPDSRLEPVDVIGLSVADQVVPEHRQVVEEALARVFVEGISARYDAAVPRPGGAVVWYSTRLGPLWREGEVVAAMLIARDVTERKRTEEMKDNLLRDVSHELRSPLARAQISLELALERLEQDPVDGGQAAKYGRMALDNVERLAGSVAAILDLSRLEAGVGAFSREMIQMDELVATLVAGMQPFASEKGLVLFADTRDPLPAVRGDREKIARVVRNLIDNAIKFSSAGQIVTSASRQHDQILVSVSDSGCGILPENLERVFDRFFQEHTGIPGVGVGLPMCRTIVEAHGGRIWAESAGRGMGATFRLVLPIPREEQTAELDRQTGGNEK